MLWTDLKKALHGWALRMLDGVPAARYHHAKYERDSAEHNLRVVKAREKQALRALQQADTRITQLNEEAIAYSKVMCATLSEQGRPAMMRQEYVRRLSPPPPE
jgi:hypothetical protein